MPLAGLVAVLGAGFLAGGERGFFYRPWSPDWQTVQTLTLVENLSLDRPFLSKRVYRTPEGGVAYETYNRYPPGTVLLLKFALLPFAGDLPAQILVAQWLMLALFGAAAVLAYLSLARITRRPPVAAAATLLVFSSSYLLGYSDVVFVEMSVALFAVMLVFHGIVLLREEERYWQLPAKVCVALLLDWHVYALLAPYLALCLAHQLARAWGSRNTTGPRPRRLAAAVWRWLRGREFLLGVVALLFGVAVLGYNLLVERAAFDDPSMAFLDLPSAQSVARRLGLDATHREALADVLAWPVFSQWQLHRIGAVSAPFVLPGHPAIFWTEWQSESAGAPFAWLGALATALCVLALLFVRRHRRAMTALAALGFCWALAVRHNAAELHHDYEAPFYLGVPLIVYAATLMFVAKRWGTRAVVGLAVVAGLAFVLSNAKMSKVRLDAAGLAREKALFAEFQTIRERVRGKDVLLALPKDAFRWSFPMPAKLHYYLAGSVVQYPNMPSARPADMVLSVTRAPSRSLLTPNHQHAFLYDSPRAVEEIAAARRREYRELAAAQPLARGEFDIHLTDGAIVLVKSSCRPADARGRWQLRFFPLDADDLPTPRRGAGFVSYAFWFGEHGVTVDDKCWATVPLPSYPLAKAWVGRWASAAGLAWQMVSTNEGMRALRRARAAALADGAAAVAHGHFDVHWARAADGGVGRELTYLRESCLPADQQARFLLHVVPVDDGDLPAASRRRGFDNRDFDFAARGAVIDGACVASVQLPNWPILHVRTGQYAPDRGVLWEAELTPRQAQEQRR